MNFKPDKSFKYDYEELKPSSQEFNFLKETFMSTFLLKGYTETKVAYIYKKK